MTFEEEFPSLDNKFIDAEFKLDGFKDEIIIHKKNMSKYCLDKKKVEKELDELIGTQITDDDINNINLRLGL